ncbi:hypothetical protein GKR69_07320 [Providencia alcalifaciens]|nr:hypothetical protein [Providencia alcalifaciens]MTC63193.1 hypothetical protein [Providencia alcalifaciens]
MTAGKPADFYVRGSRMTKAQMIARLKVLAKILGRDVDTSGTQAELEQRLMEWEEEAASLSPTGEDAEQQLTQISNDSQPVRIEENGKGVWVKMLRSCHLLALNDVGVSRSVLAVAGQRIFIEIRHADSVVAEGLAVVSEYDDA